MIHAASGRAASSRATNRGYDTSTAESRAASEAGWLDGRRNLPGGGWLDREEKERRAAAKAAKDRIRRHCTKNNTSNQKETDLHSQMRIALE